MWKLQANTVKKTFQKSNVGYQEKLPLTKVLSISVVYSKYGNKTQWIMAVSKSVENTNITIYVNDKHKAWSKIQK